jgi:DNA topoisomerase IB
MVIDYYLEDINDQTWINPKTGNKVHYARALQLGLIKPEELATQAQEPSGTSSSTTAIKHTTTPIAAVKKEKPQREPRWFDYLLPLKLTTYPFNVPQSEVTVDTTGNVNSHWVLRWKDPKTGRTVTSYTSDFMAKNKAKNRERTLKITDKHVERIKLVADKILSNDKSKDDMKQAAAIISIIRQTGLRIGGEGGLKDTGNKGISTLSPDNVKIEGDKVILDFIGKSHVENHAEFEDKILAAYLKVKLLERQMSPRLFTIPRSLIGKVYAENMGMSKYKIKDLRTHYANQIAKEMLYDSPMAPPPLPENSKQIKTMVKEKLTAVFERVSQLLNNTPAMARTSYINPKIIHSWLDELGVEPKLVKYNESYLREEDYENYLEDDDSEDVGMYPLPKWWDDDSGWELIRKKEPVKESKSISLFLTKELLEKFLNKFPDDATSWGQATDELRDLYGSMVQLVKGANKHPIPPVMNPARLTSPSAYNRIFKDLIRKVYDLLTPEQKKYIYEYYEPWWESKLRREAISRNERVRSLISETLSSRKL